MSPHQTDAACLAATQISEHAPAKINLALHVTGQRDDGYHLLDTLVVFTEAGDTISVRPEAADSFAITGSFAGTLQAESDNLVLRARDLMRELQSDLPSVALVLNKALPIASGIGGGSTDAAATLRALGRLARHPVDNDQLHAEALALGADVPMCLAARSQRVQGIGEKLTPVSGLPTLHLVLVNPGVGVATPAVFKALHLKHNAPLPPLAQNPDFATFVDWLHQTRNDLQPAAMTLAPDIGTALTALEAQGAALARMSGSGATCFGLFASATQAEVAARHIASTFPSWYVKATQNL